MEASLFAEGYVHETWRLDVEVDGSLMPMALKIFPTPELSAANEAQFRTARAKGWPVPVEYVRGPVAPYGDRHGVLRECVPERSLAAHVRGLFAGGATPDALDIAAAYSEVGRALGRLHESNRKQQSEGRADGPRLLKLAGRCESEGWCGPATKLRLESLAGKLDHGEVSFIHGDLYDEQVILDGDGRLAAFIDIDRARFGDPAEDLGSLLAHVLMVAPAARQVHWGVPDPTPEETKAVASRLLSAYREAAGFGVGAWADFLERVKAYHYLRLGVLLDRYRDNPHAAKLWAALDARKRQLVEADVFTALGLAQ